MANDILSSEIFTPTTKTESSKETSKITQEPKKEGNSLFDNLLKEAKTKVDVEEITNTKSQPSNQIKTSVETTPKAIINSEIKDTVPNTQSQTTIALKTKAEIKYFTGKVHGTIALDKKGNGGFGYDPIFIPDNYTKSFAELPIEIKQKIGHRGKAIRSLITYLKKHKFQEI